MKTLQDYIDRLNALNFKEMYNNDFFLTWEKTDEELEAEFTAQYNSLQGACPSHPLYEGNTPDLDLDF